MGLHRGYMGLHRGYMSRGQNYRYCTVVRRVVQ